MAAYFTLVSTPRSATANTYLVSVAEAKTIRNALGAMAGFGLDFTGFDAATDDQLNDLAVLAAGSLDRLNFPGFKADSSQAMQWPRVSVRKPGAEGVVPDGLKFAQVAEMAALATARSEAGLAADAGVAAYTVGKKSVTYDTDRANLNRTAAVADSTRRVLESFGLVLGSVSNVYLPRA